MKQWKRTLGAVVGSAVLGMAGVAGAQAPDVEKGRGPGRRFEAVAEYLQLTPEQRAAWHSALEAHRAFHLSLLKRSLSMGLPPARAVFWIWERVASKKLRE